MKRADAVIVTGAGRGIGREIALALGSQSIPVLCVSKSSTCEQTRDEIRARSGVAESKQLDLADYARAEAELRAWAQSKHYQRYALVLAAGSLGPNGSLQSSPLAEWDETFRVNVLGNLAAVRAVYDVMLANRFGRIAFFGGGGAGYEFPLFPAYAATKVATVRIVENLATDLAAEGDFAVVCIAPGAVETEMLAEVRRVGGEVRTTTDASEAATLVTRFMTERAGELSGRFVHVRDDWEQVLSGDKALSAAEWKLRRVE